MPDEKSLSGTLDVFTKFVTVLSLGIAAFAAYKALPLDAEIKRLDAETRRLENELKQADAELKALESSRKVTLELYQEVKKVIEKKDKDQREEDAVRVLVEALADGPFRWKLLEVIAVGAQNAKVKETAAATSKFYQEEAQVQSVAPPAPSAAPASAIAGPFNVDFFYCEKRQSTSERAARTHCP